MRKILLAAAATAAALVVAGQGLAGQPNNQACLGTDFSTYARYGAPGPVLVFPSGSGFGHFNSLLARSAGGVGGPIQGHLAGGLPDSFVVNSCND